MNKQEGCICSCATLEKPYTIEEMANDYENFVIKYKDQIICSIRCGTLKDKYGLNDTFINCMGDLLNEAYQNGFQKCGGELMKQTIKEDNLIDINSEVFNKDFISI